MTNMKSEQLRTRRIEDTIRVIENNIDSCNLGEGIIKEAFQLGWSLREFAAFSDIPFTREEADRIYSLDKKIRGRCKCAIKT